MYDEKVKLRAQDKTGADYIGGERYQEDVWRSLMRGADPRRAEKMALRAWRNRNFGDLAPHQTVQGSAPYQSVQGSAPHQTVQG